MIAPPLPARRPNHTFNAGFSVTESALTATIKDLKLTKATLFLAKATAKDIKDTFVEKKLYENCVFGTLPLLEVPFLGVALYAVAAALCLFVYAVVWLVLELLAYIAKIAYHTVDITIAGLEIFKTDFAKGE